jgi:glutamyl-tRNA synthetase
MNPATPPVEFFTSAPATLVVSRLAPTPSGYLHLGNAVNFVLTWLLVRRAGGRLHLRIDDLDRNRLRRPYLESIFRTIDWLGLDYDHGPSGPDDFLRHHSQLLHLAEYNYLLRRLRLVPGLLHASTRSRTQNLEIPADLDKPGVAWRAVVPGGIHIDFQDLWQGAVNLNLGSAMPDFVLRKKDAVVAYQLASIADDLRLGTTLIVRGLDLLPSTAAQLWLAQQLPETTAFSAERVQLLHHPLLPGPDGRKLSKSQQQPLDRGIVDAAVGPRPVYNVVAQLLGLPLEAAASLATLRQAVGGCVSEPLS